MDKKSLIFPRDTRVSKLRESVTITAREERRVTFLAAGDFPARSCSTIPEKDKGLKELLLVQCIEIFPVNSVNHLLNNGGLIISMYSFSIRLVNVSLHQDCQKTLR